MTNNKLVSDLSTLVHKLVNVFVSLLFFKTHAKSLDCRVFPRCYASRVPILLLCFPARTCNSQQLVAMNTVGGDLLLYYKYSCYVCGVLYKCKPYKLGNKRRLTKNRNY